jgi:hypothetical protein
MTRLRLSNDPRGRWLRPCSPLAPWLNTSAPRAAGEVAERLNAPHSKCGIRVTVSGVRIPPSPPTLIGSRHKASPRTRSRIWKSTTPQAVQAANTSPRPEVGNEGNAMGPSGLAPECISRMLPWPLKSLQPVGSLRSLLQTTHPQHAESVGDWGKIAKTAWHESAVGGIRVTESHGDAMRCIVRSRDSVPWPKRRREQLKRQKSLALRSP